MQVLSLALKPRALWVAAHHLDLSGRMDGLWSALLNALADLVSGNEAEVDARRQGHKALLTQGLSLILPPVAVLAENELPGGVMV